MLGESVDEFTVFINTVKLLSNEIAITPSNRMQISVSIHPWHFLYLCQSDNLTGKLRYSKAVLIYTSLIKEGMSIFHMFIWDFSFLYCVLWTACWCSLLIFYSFYYFLIDLLALFAYKSQCHAVLRMPPWASLSMSEGWGLCPHIAKSWTELEMSIGQCWDPKIGS